ncbi:MAG: hypothetical protein HY319_11370 [Armatimonadetes bacterium]|nr:hypothetical protein [Armatimonadota bacterium]
MVYEQLLDQGGEWALEEGSLHFEKESAVHRTLREVIRRLEELGVPYAVVGGMAMFLHGYRRFTEDVDVLVTPGGLEVVHRELIGRGYRPLHEGSRHLRDTERGVRVEFLVTGGYPGDGKPKPIAFPDPLTASIELDGVRVLALPQLLELKLASGMTNPGRLKDLADVQDLIRKLDLPADLNLHPSVLPKYQELWSAVRDFPE